MSPASLFFFIILKIFPFAPVILVVLVMYLWNAWRELPELSSHAMLSEKVVPKAWPDTDALPQCDWSVFSDTGGLAAPEGRGGAAKRFRLAGTFFAYSMEGGEASTRRAILDDLINKEQVIVSENDKVDGYRVVSIFRERVVLRDAAGDTDLWLSFSALGRGSEEQTVAVPGTSGTERDAESYPFGIQQIGETRWIFDRNKLLQYYQELMSEPERLVKVFDSLKPVRDETGGITGYVLEAEGEKEFFDATGLREGDIIRAVNSLPMTNRRRAEFFIHEFVKNDLNAFVLEIERTGTVKKLVYHIR